MPNPADILSLQNDKDPDDQLRMQLDQGQGNNLAGGPQPPGAAGLKPDWSDAVPRMPPQQAPGAQPVAPSPNVAGPLAALAAKPAKPHIKLKNKPPPPKAKKIKPKIKLKSQPAPSSALQNFLNAIGTNPGS